VKNLKKKICFTRLKGRRAELGLSMLDMSKRLGMAESTYLAKENGKRDFTLSECKAIGKILNEKPGRIFFDEEVS
jgi:DNA-binding XRE family transcriptional regulator